LGTRPITPASAFRLRRPLNSSLPGAFERHRLLGLELTEGALDGAWGMIVPTGASAVMKIKAARAKKALPALPNAA
jgi:hypothetical protein